MSRLGKIARLPQNLRAELHFRLENGESGLDLVRWLNDQTTVKAILQNHFQGHAITAQNLSEWRSGSHANWLRKQELSSCLPLGSEPQSDLDQLLNEASLSLESPPTPAPDAPDADLDESAVGQSLTDLMARRLALKMAMLQEQRMDEEPDPRKKWKLACALNRELARLRRQDHRAAKRALTP